MFVPPSLTLDLRPGDWPHQLAPAGSTLTDLAPDNAYKDDASRPLDSTDGVGDQAMSARCVERLDMDEIQQLNGSTKSPKSLSAVLGPNARSEIPARASSSRCRCDGLGSDLDLAAWPPVRYGLTKCPALPRVVLGTLGSLWGAQGRQACDGQGLLMRWRSALAV
jgi:hypothetical protein